MQFFFRYTGDYGLAIILLTVTVRLVILPLTIRQTKSMQQMKKLGPKMKELQEKHKKDKQKLQEEMMKFYQEHQFNPLSGCLPLLLQLPIMFALFQVLLEPAKKGQQQFLFFISDLSLFPGAAQFTKLGLAAAFPYYILIVLMIVTTYIPSKMMSTDPQQDRMMIFMALFMGFIGWRLPAGVVLYLLITNVWTIAQQYVALRGAEA